jgi:hypothetical protein
VGRRDLFQADNTLSALGQLMRCCTAQWSKTDTIDVNHSGQSFRLPPLQEFGRAAPSPLLTQLPPTVQM